MAETSPAPDTRASASVGDSTLEKWLLSASERMSRSSRVDRRPDSSEPWTLGNYVKPLVHGAVYFARLHEELSGLGAGDRVWFLGWRGDADERLVGPGTEVGTVLAQAAGRGVDVRGLLWRSHPDQEKFSEQENAHLGHLVNEAGGVVLLDERVRRFGSHHQKLVVIQRAGRGGGNVAFVGGIDLSHGRGDDEAHAGDPQAIALDRRYGPTPPWHDIQLEIRGPALGDLLETFRERWADPTPLDRGNPWRGRRRRHVRDPRRARPLPDSPPPPPPTGHLAVQVLRTYPAKRPPYPFAPRGERSVARGYMKALARARSLVYLEDQYLWSSAVAHVLARALLRSPTLRLIAVVPRYPDWDGRVSGPLNRVGQLEALQIIRRAGGDRVGVYDLEGESGRPIYVHAKVCVIDDVWMAVGSDNLNRRSWTHDSEVSCAVVDPTRDKRAPTDPGGLGDGARVLARDLRLALWREHLGPEVRLEELLDPVSGFDAWERVAASLDRWHDGGERGERPSGRVRRHIPAPLGSLTSLWARPVYRMAIDPDGRPLTLKWTGGF